MTFVTKLEFRSGDRAALENTVADLKRLLERKGVECNGPHSSPPETVRVPQYRHLKPGAEFPSWRYTVYSRRVEINGNERIARQIAHREFPESVHVKIEVEQRQPLGNR